MKPVDEHKHPDYYEDIKEPMCLETMLEKNMDNEYETVDEVRADCKLIAANAKKYNPDNELRVASYASEFEDAAFLKLECIDEELVFSWNEARAQRDARHTWEAKKQPKPEEPKRERAPFEPAPRAGARTSARLCGAKAEEVHESEGSDALPHGVVRKFTAHAARMQTSPSPVQDLLAVCADAEAAAEQYAPKLAHFVEKAFIQKQEHAPLSLASGQHLVRLEHAVDEFLAKLH